MSSKVDMIVDVSKRLTECWVCANLLGVSHYDAWFYRENPELYREDMPATFDLVIEKATSLPREQAAFMLEGLACGLFDLCVSEGFFG